MLVGTDEYDPADGIKFIASQLHVIGCRMAETFSLWGFVRSGDELD